MFVSVGGFCLSKNLRKPVKAAAMFIKSQKAMGACWSSVAPVGLPPGRLALTGSQKYSSKFPGRQKFDAKEKKCYTVKKMTKGYNMTIAAETEKTAETTGEESTENPASFPSSTPAPDAGEQSPVPSPAASQIDDILENFDADWPEAVPHFVAAVKAETAEAEDRETAAVDFRLLKDANGHYYDPVKCSTKMDVKTGLPEKSKKGMWILRKGVKRDDLSKKRPKIEEGAGPASLESGIDAEQAAALAALHVRKVQAAQAAQVIDSVAWIAIKAATLGDPTPTEQAAGKMALENWLLSRDSIPEPPAWMVPILIYGQAAGVRLMAPKAEPRRAMFKEKFSLFVAWLKGFKAGGGAIK